MRWVAWDSRRTVNEHKGGEEGKEEDNIPKHPKESLELQTVVNQQRTIEEPSVVLGVPDSW